jgi:hypothetical protein
VGVLVSTNKRGTAPAPLLSSKFARFLLLILLSQEGDDEEDEDDGVLGRVFGARHGASEGA